MKRCITMDLTHAGLQICKDSVSVFVVYRINLLKDLREDTELNRNPSVNNRCWLMGLILLIIWVDKYLNKWSVQLLLPIFHIQTVHLLNETSSNHPFGKLCYANVLRLCKMWMGPTLPKMQKQPHGCLDVILLQRSHNPKLWREGGSAMISDWGCWGIILSDWKQQRSQWHVPSQILALLLLQLCSFFKGTTATGCAVATSGGDKWSASSAGRGNCAPDFSKSTM